MGLQAQRDSSRRLGRNIPRKQLLVKSYAFYEHKIEVICINIHLLTLRNFLNLCCFLLCLISLESEEFLRKSRHLKIMQLKVQ